MTLDEVMRELRGMASEQTRKTFIRQGVPEDRLIGVKVGDMKKLLKQIKGDQPLAMKIYATGNFDAMYLAGLAADGSKMTRKQLETWARQAEFSMISEYTIPGVAAESEYAVSLANKWIESRKEHIAASGWATWAAIVATQPDENLDLDRIETLVDRVIEEVHTAPNRVRYTMNGFVISVGGYVKPLLSQAKAAAKRIGKVDVNMGDTACKVPLATEYIAKIEDKGRVGKKRATVKC
jgi:3-methyladenine DNA glycosylase AlkD